MFVAREQADSRNVFKGLPTRKCRGEFSRKTTDGRNVKTSQWFLGSAHWSGFRTINHSVTLLPSADGLFMLRHRERLSSAWIPTMSPSSLFPRPSFLSSPFSISHLQRSPCLAFLAILGSDLRLRSLSLLSERTGRLTGARGGKERWEFNLEAEKQEAGRTLQT